MRSALRTAEAAVGDVDNVVLPVSSARVFQRSQTIRRRTIGALRRSFRRIAACDAVSNANGRSTSSSSENEHMPYD